MKLEVGKYYVTQDKILIHTMASVTPFGKPYFAISGIMPDKQLTIGFIEDKDYVDVGSFIEIGAEEFAE